jgi:hypothetical protein
VILPSNHSISVAMVALGEELNAGHANLIFGRVIPDETPIKQ